MERTVHPPLSFLLVDFGSTFIKFFLLLREDSTFKIKAKSTLFSFLDATSKEAESFFLEAIKDLERKSGRRLLYKDVLLIKEKSSEGVEKVLFSGDENFKNQLSSFSEIPFLTRLENLRQAATFLSKIFPEIFILDIGSSFTQVAYSFPKKGIQMDLLEFGVGKNAGKSLDKIGNMENVLQWLTFKADLDEIEDYFGNKAIYPATLPISKKDLEREQALVREILRNGLDHSYLDFPEKKFLLLSGRSLVNAPKFSQTALMVLDGLEPEGMQTFLADEDQFLGVFGHLALVYPLVARSLVEKTEIFPKKAQFVSISCEGKKTESEDIGQAIFDFGMKEEGKINLELGDVYLIPEKEKEVNITFDLNPPFFIKRLKEEETLAKSQSQLGVIIDARGRPLNLPGLTNEDKERIASWYRMLEVSCY